MSVASKLLSRNVSRSFFGVVAACNRKSCVSQVAIQRTFATLQQDEKSTLPDSITRVGQTEAFPNEYPGQIYSFNWCLNGEGVTPLKRSAFRITKPLDLKIAGLPLPKTMPLKVTANLSSVAEAGSDSLSFEDFDSASQEIRDLLSLSDHLYCPEGHVPGTRTGVRIITNSDTLAPQLLAYLERAPKQEPADSLPITVYALSGGERSFQGYAIEEVEIPIYEDNPDDWHEGTGYESVQYEAKSVASVVVSGETSVETIVAGIELSQKALAEDELSREAEKKAAAEGKDE